MVLTVPERVLVGSSYPAVLDPLISPEFGVDTPVAGDPPYYAWDIQAARAGGTYLVAWRDERISSSPGIFGSRLGEATGGLLDPTGFQIVQSHDLVYCTICSPRMVATLSWSGRNHGAASTPSMRVECSRTEHC